MGLGFHMARAAFAGAAWFWAAGAEPPAEPVLDPRPTDLVETTASRLAQLDITVSGPPELVATLTPDDFSIKINRTKITEFQLDRFCEPAAGDSSAPGGTAPASYLLYFDQPHLTLSGRQRALDVARQLVPRLVAGGGRALVVSNARRLAVIQELSGDADVLLAALDRLEGDRSQWDTYSTEEDLRTERVVDLLTVESDTARATSLARAFQREEGWRTERNLRRLATTLTWLAEVDPPKAAIYFADTMRSNPGEHYLSFFGTLQRERSGELAHVESDAFASAQQFDRVVNEASSIGLRFYTIHAQGLFTPLDRGRADQVVLTRTHASPNASRVRYRDAQKTMTSMAAETGGQAFLNGIAADKIAQRIEDDFSCIYLASFDPGDLALDAPLRVVAKVSREGVKAHSRGRIVLQSRSARLTSKLLAAFASPESGSGSASVQVQLVPTGFVDGAYSALLQISVPATALPSATWDLGATLISRDRVREEVSGRLSVERPGVTAVLEREVSLKPGSYEIVAVAHESRTGFVLSERFELDWPDPDRQAVSIGPITLLQPIAGAFVREGETRLEGSLARSEGEPVLTELPTALVGLVCRGRRHSGPLAVERSLVGAQTVEFPELEFDPGDERCVQFRDLVPQATVGPGFYRYEVRVRGSGQSTDESAREFVALDPEG